MIIEEGKFYKTVDGRKVGPMKYDRGDYFGSGAWVKAGLDLGKYNPQAYSDRGDVVAMQRGEESDRLISEWIDETDLTKNTTAFGLMSKVDQDRMDRLPICEVEFFGGSYGWMKKATDVFVRNATYRQRQTPTRVSIADLKGTVEIGDDGKPKWNTYEDLTG